MDKAVHELRGSPLQKALVVELEYATIYMCVVMDREFSLDLVLVKPNRTTSTQPGAEFLLAQSVEMVQVWRHSLNVISTYVADNYSVIVANRPR